MSIFVRAKEGPVQREGVEIYYGLRKAGGGLVRTAEEIFGKEIQDIAISGDFMFHPKEHFTGLEESLKKVPLEEDQIIKKVGDYYGEKGVESPGVESKDFGMAILDPLEDSMTNQES